MATLAIYRSTRATLPQWGSHHFRATLVNWRRGFSSYLVSPEELNEALKKNAPSPISTDPRVIPLCAAWFMPNDPESRTGIQVYREKRIRSLNCLRVGGPG